jgi:hypothetical protein
MKKISVAAFMVIITFALWEAAFTAAPDAGVKGLWLKAPNFPIKAEVVEFSGDAEMDMVDYTRVLADGSGVEFLIHRQPIEESELRSPDDVRDFIEMRVYNDEGYDEGSSEAEARMRTIEIDDKAEGLSARFSYPCAMAMYEMGWNEDTRRYVSLFIFTDKYCFFAEASAPVDMYEDYENKFVEWFTGLVWSSSNNAPEKTVRIKYRSD